MPKVCEDAECKDCRTGERVDGLVARFNLSSTCRSVGKKAGAEVWGLSVIRGNGDTTGGTKSGGVHVGVGVGSVVVALSGVVASLLQLN